MHQQNTQEELQNTDNRQQTYGKNNKNDKNKYDKNKNDKEIDIINNKNDKKQIWLKSKANIFSVTNIMLCFLQTN